MTDDIYRMQDHIKEVGGRGPIWSEAPPAESKCLQNIFCRACGGGGAKGVKIKSFCRAGVGW